MRSAVTQAQNAGTTAANTGAGYGASASAIGSSLVPFEQRQLTNPSGYSQQDIGAMLSSGLAGGGGAAAGIYGAAGKNASTTRNPMGFSGALDAAAMQRAKGAAGTSEGITAQNAGVKLNQQQQAGDLLSKMYGTDVAGENAATEQIAPDVNAASNASKTGWMQNLTGILSALSGGADAASNVRKAFG